MTEWKVRQEMFHRITQYHSDDLSMFEVETSDDIIHNTVRYFTTRDIGWIYPAKSYAVGICYASWIAEYFGGTPLDYLNDPALLYNNDPYFVPYDDDMCTYNAILDEIGGWAFDQTRGLVPDMKNYFIAEFFIEDMSIN